jgi:hypothetical protein
MTSGKEDGESSGSDSEPSADNLEEEEMAQIVPIKKKAQPEPKKEEKKEVKKEIKKEITKPIPVVEPPPVKEKQKTVNPVTIVKEI